MGKFLTPLLLEDLGRTDDSGRELFKLHEELIYEVGQNGTRMFIKVPSGYITDFASIPRFFWRILPPFGVHGRAAVMHDYLCQCSNCSRLVGDALFYEAMGSLGVPPWRRISMYLGVRFYWIVWGKWFNNPKNRPYHLDCEVNNVKRLNGSN